MVSSDNFLLWRRTNERMQPRRRRYESGVRPGGDLVCGKGCPNARVDGPMVCDRFAGPTFGKVVEGGKMKRCACGPLG